MLQTAANLPAEAVRTIAVGRKDAPTFDPVDVQQSLLRFADGFSARMALSIDKLQRESAALDAGAALRWRIIFATEICVVASGPNPVANLLDLTTMVTATRVAVETQLQPDRFGVSGLPLLESCRSAEVEIWQLAARVLSKPEQDELRATIEEWTRKHPLLEDLLTARAVGFALNLSQLRPSNPTTTSSVFDLLKLDPLSGLDPATREIAQTRLLAERALFVSQKMPYLLRWQAEYLGIRMSEIPAVQQMVTNSTVLTRSVERLSQVAEQFPARFSAEREEILRGLQSQERQLTPLVNEVRQALLAGSSMSTSLNTTLVTFDALMKRFGVGETNRSEPRESDAEPFRIQEYGKTAAQLDAAAARLTELLRLLDQTLGSTNLTRLAAQVQPVVQQAETVSKDVVDYAFRKGVLLLLLALAAGLTYRFISRRLGPSPGTRPQT